MNDHLFRTKAPELLVDLAAHTASSIRQVLDVSPEVAEQIGQAVANNMMRVWGGQNVYMPLGMSWKLSQRDRDIFNECNGRNHHELARKYGVSLQWIYAVVKRVKKEELERVQGNLFDDTPEQSNRR
ncbi:Mor transcription activator family protein [Serratia marcescens]|uniref:Mor transcription activator family protein n=1 Tax=Serratia marcescens TaxID=615 RepID=UPI0025AAE1C4|nr:Mor transcription activator family protein [Serratia marcescens]MDN0028189.1 Mor transcription activator family protein [Serratia marcescens]HDW3810916.1 DNA-binding protein [Klebsiella pneumoniae]